MTPISYTVQGQFVKFRYNLAELKEWIRLGNLEGNVGSILVNIDYAQMISVYIGYGTIENPRNSRFTFRFNHFDIFGKMATPEEILHPKTFDELYPDMGYFVPDGKGGVKRL